MRSSNTPCSSATSVVIFSGIVLGHLTESATEFSILHFDFCRLFSDGRSTPKALHFADLRATDFSYYFRRAQKHFLISDSKFARSTRACAPEAPGISALKCCQAPKSARQFCTNGPFRAKKYPPPTQDKLLNTGGRLRRLVQPGGIIPNRAADFAWPKHRCDEDSPRRTQRIDS